MAEKPTEEMALSTEDQELESLQMQGGITIRQDMTLRTLGKTIAASSFFKGITPEKAVVKILSGHELGLGPMASMRTIHVFDGKVEIGASALVALIKRSGKYRFEVVRLDNEACELKFMERDRALIGPGEWITSGPASFTWEEAQTAGLAGKDNWKKYRQDMLFARAVSRGFRRYCADLAGGAVYSEGEVAEIEPPQDKAAALNARLSEPVQATAQDVVDAEAATEATTVAVAPAAVVEETPAPAQSQEPEEEPEEEPEGSETYRDALKEADDYSGDILIEAVENYEKLAAERELTVEKPPGRKPSDAREYFARLVDAVATYEKQQMDETAR